jgi:hypothetical protein
LTLHGPGAEKFKFGVCRGAFAISQPAPKALLLKLFLRRNVSLACGRQAFHKGNTVMKTDAELRADLMERLDAIPAIGGSDIEVLVDNGMVTLSGQVDTQQTKFQVERTARRVMGMRGLTVNVKPQAAPRKHHH